MNIYYINNIHYIITIQKYIRKFISNKNNIYLQHKNEIIQQNFINELNGFHIIIKEPIKETIWEKINENIISNIFNVNYSSNGSHLSGIDNQFNNWKILNKTGIIKNNGKILISSYRLSSICDKNNISTPKNIINEITKRNKSFDYYSILLRDEKIIDNKIKYYLCIIPKNYFIFQINNNDLQVYYGKKENKKNEILGYKSQNASITFSMSSQLWFHFTFNDIKKYIIYKHIVNLNEYNNISFSKFYKIIKENKELFK